MIIHVYTTNNSCYPIKYGILDESIIKRDINGPISVMTHEGDVSVRLDKVILSDKQAKKS